MIGIVKAYRGFSVPCNGNEVDPSYRDKKDDLVKMIKLMVLDETWSGLIH